MDVVIVNRDQNRFFIGTKAKIIKQKVIEKLNIDSKFEIEKIIHTSYFGDLLFYTKKK